MFHESHCRYAIRFSVFSTACASCSASQVRQSLHSRQSSIATIRLGNDLAALLVAVHRASDEVSQDLGIHATRVVTVDDDFPVAGDRQIGLDFRNMSGNGYITIASSYTQIRYRSVFRPWRVSVL